MKKTYEYIIIFITIVCFLTNSTFMHSAWATKKETLRPLSTGSQRQRADIQSILENTLVAPTVSTPVSARKLLFSASAFNLFAKENNVPLGSQQARDLLGFFSAFSYYNQGGIISVSILRYSDRKNGIQVLLLRTDKGAYVLKRYPHSSISALIKKNEILKRHLRKNSFPYILGDELLTKAGRKEVRLDEYGYVLYPWQGYNLGHMHPTVEKGVIQMANVMADVHVATRSLDGIDTISQPFIDFFSVPRDLLREFNNIASAIRQAGFKESNKSRELFLSAEYQTTINLTIQKLSNEFSPQLNAALPKMVIHGDLQSRNVLVGEGGEVVALIDFDDAVVGSRLWDIVHNFYIWMNDLQKELKRPLVPADIRNLVFAVIENYTLALDNEEGLSEKEIVAAKSYLKGYLLYEIFYRARLLPSSDPEDHHNTKLGDEKFALDLNNLSLYLSLLDGTDLSGLQKNLNEALKAKKCIRKVFEELEIQNEDPLLVPEDVILAKAKLLSSVNITILRKAYHQQIDLLIRKRIFKAGSLEAAADDILQAEPEKGVVLLKKAKNILERLSVASGFEEHYLSEHARLNRKIERICYANLTLIPQDRRDHIVLIPTQNRSISLEALLRSIYDELKIFHFGRYDKKHKIIFTVVEDSTDPDEIRANKNIMQKYCALLRGLSLNYEIQYWDSDRQEEELDRINRVVFNREWDIRQTLYASNKDRLAKKKDYARIRNLGLIIARRLSMEFQSPEEALITWIDDDTQLGTTVIHRNGVRESGVHAINYFEKTQEGFASGDTGLLLGSTTRDSVNTIGQLQWMSDILHVFEQVATKDQNEAYLAPSIPFSVFAGVGHGEILVQAPLLFDHEVQSPMAVGEYLLYSLETFKYFPIGRAPFRTLSYLPPDWRKSDDSKVAVFGTQRMAGGDNTSFLMESFSQVVPYLLGMERGEDLFKNIIDAGMLNTGYGVVNTKSNPIDHYRLSGRRIDILQEIFKHYLGIIRVNLSARLIKDILLAKGAESFTENSKVFLNLEHLGLIEPGWLEELIRPEEHIDFSDWRQAETQNYNYIRSFIQEAQRVARLIREKGYLTDKENPDYFWLRDDRYSEALQILNREFVSVFEKDKVVPQMERSHREAALQTTNEHYQEFMNDIKQYGQNLKNWIKFWNYKIDLSGPDEVYVENTVVFPMQSLFHIAAGSEQKTEQAMPYSRLKLGDVQQIEIFSSLLSRRIQEQHGVATKLDPDNWVIVNPGGFGINNAASLVAAKVSEKLGIPHFKLETGLALDKNNIYHYASLARAERRQMVVHNRRKLNAPEVINGKNVILIDDAIVTGTIMNEAIRLVAEAGAKCIEPYTLVCLDAPENDSTFEWRVNRLVLNEHGIEPLYTALNDQNAIYTTRLVYYTFELAPNIFSRILSHLTSSAKLNLYVHAIEYFGSNIPGNFDILAEALRLESGLSFSQATVFKNIQNQDFFEAITEVLKSYKYRIPFEESAAIKQKLDRLLSEEEARRKGIKVILYDLDGTLFHSKEYREAIGVATHKFLSERLGVSSEAIETKIDFLRNRLKILGLPLRQHIIAKEFGVSWHALDNFLTKNVSPKKYIARDPELIRILQEQCKKGYSLGIVSDGTCQQTYNILAALGVADLFKHTVTADSVGVNKPEVQLYEEALSLFGIVAEQAFMVGDSMIFDISPARTAGLYALHISSRKDLLELLKEIQLLEKLRAGDSSYLQGKAAMPMGRHHIQRAIDEAA